MMQAIRDGVIEAGIDHEQGYMQSKVSVCILVVCINVHCIYVCLYMYTVHVHVQVVVAWQVKV